MDPLGFLKAKKLLQFFCQRKNQMSCMEKPHTFLRQLRDYDLLPEDSYKKVSRMKNKEKLKKSLYDILDWLERERPKHIHKFWSCVFKKPIINQYPALKLMRKSLLDASPLKKRAKSKLPVTCGDKKGTLYRGKMAKGEKCIWSQKQWFTPPEFEKFGGKKSKKWKLSIRSNNTPLGKLIQEGHLPSARFRGGCKKHNAIFRSLGDRLKELFDGEFKRVFNIYEPTVG